MKNLLKKIIMVCVGGILFPTLSLSAPLDEFLTASPGFEPWHGEGEVGVDLMNNSVDVLGMRTDSYASTNSSVGNYRGGHVKGGLALTRRIWVDGGAWSRKITTPYDSGESLTLHGAAQFQVTQPFGWFPAVALRLSGWRNSADEAIKGSPTSLSFGGVSVDASRVRVENPHDNQVQLDMISTWNTSHNSALSMFLSYGKSKVDFDKLFVNNLHAKTSTAESTVTGEMQIKQGSGQSNVDVVCVSSGGCNQNVTFANGYLNANVVQNDSILLPSSAQAPDGMNIAYDANFYQAGGMYAWTGAEWRAKLGYRYIKLNRDVDEAVSAMGKKVIDSNHFLTGEIGYKPPFDWFEHFGFFVRGQAMSNQFVGEIPFTYNALSAHKFDARYGVVTLGVTGGF
ncbi:MAG: hypothetical protein HQL93_00325 [Magnetococcales bacterium]|nr:hypothetical protein [Magnetococcales bacterium]